jgi:hypothetical protein
VSSSARLSRFLHPLDEQRELRVDEQRLLPRHGMDAHDGMRGRAVDFLEMPQLAPAFLALGEQRLERLEIVHRLEPRDEVLHAVGKALVGGGHAVKRRIPADLRDDFRTEHRAQRRTLAERLVGMPDVGRRRRIAFLVVVDDQLRTVGGVGGERMDGEFAEVAAEPLEIFRADGLLREDEHLVRGERLGDGVDDRAVERPRQIDPGDLGAEEDAELAQRQRAVRFRGRLNIVHIVLHIARTIPEFGNRWNQPRALQPRFYLRRRFFGRGTAAAIFSTMVTSDRRKVLFLIAAKAWARRNERESATKESSEAA